jgi:hypothetical protein
MSKPMYGGQPVTGGYLALQSESQPTPESGALTRRPPGQLQFFALVLLNPLRHGAKIIIRL